ncbi:AGAP003080-PB-like protein [Anopheles sinensis]|uniref:AGAP003080-PB-like protein n=1 Tax=Anopheles sinensis TaxID=74873 RepID=A0A084W8Z6_ANOSI|nr:AGAP003080-PB-like protein [Anopheles sinensis]
MSLEVICTSFKDFPSPDIARSMTGPDILQKHSINSLLLEHNEIISRGLPSPIEDNMSLTNLLGGSQSSSPTSVASSLVTSSSGKSGTNHLPQLHLHSLHHLQQSQHLSHHSSIGPFGTSLGGSGATGCEASNILSSSSSGANSATGGCASNSSGGGGCGSGSSGSVSSNPFTFSSLRIPSPSLHSPDLLSTGSLLGGGIMGSSHSSSTASNTSSSSTSSGVSCGGGSGQSPTAHPYFPNLLQSSGGSGDEAVSVGMVSAYDEFGFDNDLMLGSGSSGGLTTETLKLRRRNISFDCSSPTTGTSSPGEGTPPSLTLCTPRNFRNGGASISQQQATNGTVQYDHGSSGNIGSNNPLGGFEQSHSAAASGGSGANGGSLSLFGTGNGSLSPSHSSLFQQQQQYQQATPSSGSTPFSAGITGSTSSGLNLGNGCPTDYERLQNLQAFNTLSTRLLQQSQQLSQLQQYQYNQSLLPSGGGGGIYAGGAGGTNGGNNGYSDINLDRIARFHRSSAAHYDATCTWCGDLPPRSNRLVTYSSKIFLGGMPWDISEQSLVQIFKPFGSIKVEWPGKEQQATQPKGYVYVIFESDKQVKALLQACTYTIPNGGGSSGGHGAGSGYGSTRASSSNSLNITAPAGGSRRLLDAALLQACTYTIPNGGGSSGGHGAGSGYGSTRASSSNSLNNYGSSGEDQGGCSTLVPMANLSKAQVAPQGAKINFKISSKRIKSKDVEVIPWNIADSNYVKSTSQKLDPTKTVFVGALHGQLTAEGLAKIMNDLFDGVVYVGIDTDKYKYPLGSARVTFNNSRSYMKAVVAAFIEIRTTKFTKKLQVDPYLEDSLCSTCAVQHGPYFCREIKCFRYYCRSCWQYQHSQDPHMQNHKPLTRNSKFTAIIGVGPQQQQQQHSQGSNSGGGILSNHQSQHQQQNAYDHGSYYNHHHQHHHHHNGGGSNHSSGSQSNAGGARNLHFIGSANNIGGGGGSGGATGSGTDGNGGGGGGASRLVI